MTSAPGLHPRKLPLWRRLWTRFWALPAAIMVGSVALGVLLPQLELNSVFSLPGLFAGGPDGARSVLSTIASAMISVTVLVFSVTIVVLQLASSQFTPRVIGSFLESRVAQVTLGVFIGSFLYSLTVLRSVRGGGDDPDAFVPEATVTLSYLYVLASVAMFLAFMQHITSRVQVSRVISDLGEETLQALDSGEDDDSGSTRRSPSTLERRRDEEGTPLPMEDRHGHVVTIASDKLTSLAAEHEVVVMLHVSLGDFLVPGQVVGTVRPEAPGPAPELGDDVLTGFTDCFQLERERDVGNDPMFGTRQLVDIAERALSAGINDPTTATQVVNEAHRVLRVLSTRPDPRPVIHDSDGRERATYSPQTFRRHLDLVVDELWFYGEGNAQVREALVTMLDELRLHASNEHVGAIDDARARCNGDEGS